MQASPERLDDGPSLRHLRAGGSTPSRGQAARSLQPLKSTDRGGVEPCGIGPSESVPRPCGFRLFFCFKSWRWVTPDSDKPPQIWPICTFRIAPSAHCPSGRPPGIPVPSLRLSVKPGHSGVSHEDTGNSPLTKSSARLGREPPVECVWTIPPMGNDHDRLERSCGGDVIVAFRSMPPGWP